MGIDYEVIVFLFSSLASGVVGNIAGIGGGVFLMIIFLFAFKINPVIAGGLSLITILASTIAGSTINKKQGAIDKRLLYTIGIFAGIGAVIGSVLSNYITVQSFSLFFGIVVFMIGVLSYTSFRMEISRNIGKSYTQETFREYRKKSGNNHMAQGKGRGTEIVAFVSGMLAGLFGLGIGGIMGTFLTAIRHIHPKIAFSTVVAAMIETSIHRTLIHFMKFETALYYYLLALPLVAGGAIGGLIGAILSGNMTFSRLRRSQSYIVMFFGILAISMSLINFV
jgi:uncharacterized membrane protein YfcA